MIKHLTGREIPEVRRYLQSKKWMLIEEARLFQKQKEFHLKGFATRDWMEWGTYGIDGKSPKHIVILKNMSDEHIEKILETQFHILRFYEHNFKKELKLRKQHPEYSIKET